MSPTSSWDAAFLDLHRQVDDLFEELIYRPWAISARAGWRPPLDLHETEEGYMIEIDLPGVPPDQVQVLVGVRNLTVTGQRQATSPDGVLFQQCERPCGTFQRVLNLAKVLDPKRARAEWRHGTCRIYLPKKGPTNEPAEPSALRVEGSRYLLRVTVS